MRGIVRRVAVAVVLTTSVVAQAATVAVVPKKLTVVDRLVIAGRAKLTFVAKDANVAKGQATNPDDVEATFTVRYANGSATGSFVLPRGASDGTAGWRVNTATVAKFVNKTAPSGPTEAKAAVFKAGKLAKLVGKGLGDTPFDVLRGGDPGGSVYTAYCIRNGADDLCHCSELTRCAWDAIAAGTGARLVCKGGVGDPDCRALSGPTTTTTTTTSTTTTTTPGAPAITLRLVDTPLVGVSRDATLEVELSQPAPAGGVTVALTVDDPSLLEVPSGVDIPGGETTVQTTIRGIDVGQVTVTGSAPGHTDGVLAIIVTGELIVLPLDASIGVRESIELPVLLNRPAPVGGIDVAIASSEPDVVVVETPVVHIPAGLMAANGSYRGLRAGTARISGSNPAYASDHMNVAVTAALVLSPSPVRTLNGVPTQLTVTFTVDGVAHVAPPEGLAVTLTVADPGCVSLSNASPVIPAGQTQVSVDVMSVPPGTCSTTITATSAETLPVSVAVTPAPALAFSGLPATSIGLGLQRITTAAALVQLGSAAPQPGVTVTVTSQNPGCIGVSTALTAAPAVTAVYELLPGATATPALYVHSMPGAALGCQGTLTASAAGYQGATSATQTVVQSHFALIGLASTVSIGETDDFFLSVGLGTGGGLTQQPARGGAPLCFAMTSSAPTVGELVTTVGSGPTGSVCVQPGVAISPTSVGGGGIAFRGLASGTTTVTGSGNGMLACTAGTCGASRGAVDVTVQVPPLAFVNLSAGNIGLGLQRPQTSPQTGVSLDAPAPAGGVTVTVTSQDPSCIGVSTSASAAPAASVGLLVNASGQNAGPLFVHSAVGAAPGCQTTLVATAPGYQTATSTTQTVVQSHFSLSSLASAVSVGETDPFTIAPGVATGSGLALQPARGGAPLCFSVSSDVVAVGELFTTVPPASGATVAVCIPPGSLTSPTTTSAGGIAFRGVSPGITTVTASGNGMLPCTASSCGTSAAAPRGAIAVTVDVPPLSFSNLAAGTIGAGLQRPQPTAGTRVLLDAPAPAGGTQVTVTSQDPACIGVSAAAADAPAAFVVLPVPAGDTQTERLYVHSAPGASACQTTLVATAAGYASVVSPVQTVVQSHFAITNLAATLSVGREDPFTVAVGIGTGGGLGVQPARGGTPLCFTVSSSDAIVAQVVTTVPPAAGAAVPVCVAPGALTSPLTLAAGGVALRGISSSTTVVTAAGNGMLPCDAGSCGTLSTSPRGVITVTVDVPPLVFSNLTATSIGAALQRPQPTSGTRVLLDAPAPDGGVQVTVSSQDPACIGVSGAAADAPAPAIVYTVPADGAQTGLLYIHAAVGAPLNCQTTLLATAEGYQTATSATQTVVQSRFAVVDLGATVPVGGTDEFRLSVGVPTGTGLALQPARGGAPLCFTASTDAPAVGEIFTTVPPASGQSVPVCIAPGTLLSPTTLAQGGAAFRGLASGTTSVTATGNGMLPCGAGTCGTQRGIVAVTVGG